MKPIFEYNDTLNNPYEAFLFNSQTNPFPITPHWHYFIEIIYLLNGDACVQSGTQTFILQPGDLLIFHPQVIHSISFHTTPALQYYVIKFAPVYLNLTNSNLPNLSSLLHMVQENPELPIVFTKQMLNGLPLKDLFEKSVEVISKKEFGYDIIIHSYYCLIIAELLKIWKKQGFQINPQQQKNSIHERFASIAEYIIQHYQEPLSVSSIAEHFHMSYSHFALKFKEYYGQSCKDFIKQIRIQKAEDLLRFTDLDLSYISQETGFCDCSHFIHVFKEYHGITPKKFRQLSINWIGVI